MASEIEDRQVRELQEKDQELAERVAAATLEQIRMKMDADLKILAEHVPSREKEQYEANLDLKYLSQRQQRLGVIFCRGGISFCLLSIQHAHCKERAVVRERVHEHALQGHLGRGQGRTNR